MLNAYGTLLELIAEVSAGQPGLAGDSAERLDLERYGATRVGTAAEVATLRRLFAVMGSPPVGYYDLSVAGCRYIPSPSAFRLPPSAQCSRQACRSIPFASSLRYCAWS